MRACASASVAVVVDPHRPRTDGFDWVAGASGRLALSYLVLRQARHALGWTRKCSMAQLRAVLQAERCGQVVTIRCTDYDARRAVDVARTVAAAYAAWTLERAEEATRLEARQRVCEQDRLESARRDAALHLAQALGSGPRDGVERLCAEYLAVKARSEALRGRVAELRASLRRLPLTVQLSAPEEEGKEGRAPRGESA
jgi:hypothetical protein